VNTRTSDGCTRLDSSLSVWIIHTWYTVCYREAISTFSTMTKLKAAQLRKQLTPSRYNNF